MLQLHKLHSIKLYEKIIINSELIEGLELCGCGLFQGTIPAFARRKWGKPQKSQLLTTMPTSSVMYIDMW